MKTMKTWVKHSLAWILSLINRSYLLEYWSIRRNERATQTSILRLYEGFIYEGMKVLDVGANAGHYAKAFLDLGAEVASVEPVAYCQQILRKRFQSNTRFKLFPFALGAAPGTANIQISNSHTLSSMSTDWINGVKSSHRFDHEHWARTESVKVVTVDEIMKASFVPDYLKIDVEGFELEVLKGLTVAVPYISFEITLPEATYVAHACVDRIGALSTYEFTIPETGQLKNETVWRRIDEMHAFLEQLHMTGEKISTDIFSRTLK